MRLKLAVKILNALLPFKTVRDHAEMTLAAGPIVLLKRATPLPLLSGNASSFITALIILQLSQQKMLKIPLTASRKSARLNMLLAKRTPSAFPLSKIVRKSAEAAKPVGSSASLEREVRPLLTQPSAQPLMDVLALQNDLLIHSFNA